MMALHISGYFSSLKERFLAPSLSPCSIASPLYHFYHKALLIHHEMLSVYREQSSL